MILCLVAPTWKQPVIVSMGEMVPVAGIFPVSSRLTPALYRTTSMREAYLNPKIYVAFQNAPPTANVCDVLYDPGSQQYSALIDYPNARRKVAHGKIAFGTRRGTIRRRRRR